MMIPDPGTLKLMLGTTVAGTAWLADAAANLPTGSWEDYGVKGMLVLAVGYLVRELARQRDMDKVDAVLREKEMTAALNSNSIALQKLIEATDHQTAYYREVAQTIISARMNADEGGKA